MPAGDIMRATIEARFTGEPVVMDLGFVSNSALPTFVEDATELANELIGVLDLDNSAGLFLSPLSVQFQMTGVRVQDMSPGVSAGIVVPASGAGGNTTDDALPSICALCVTWRTGLKGVSGRGRTYLTGFAEDSQNGSFWIGEIQTWAQDNFAGNLLGSFGPTSGADYALSLIHTVSGGVRLTPPTADPLLSFTINNSVRSQRRRGAGVRISRRPTGP